jgi:hypothetical protein
LTCPLAKEAERKKREKKIREEKQAKKESSKRCRCGYMH